MQTGQQIHDKYLSETKSDTSANSKRGWERINEYQNKICARKAYPWLNDSRSYESVSGEFKIDAPRNCRQIRLITIVIGGTKYFPEQYFDPTTFGEASRNQENTRSDRPVGFMFRGDSIEFTSKFSTNGIDIIVDYGKKVTPLKRNDYKTGSVAVTNGSKTVTGTGTQFTSFVKKGQYVVFEDSEEAYEIESITDNDTLVLVQKYQGDTESGIENYRIGDVSIIPSEFQDLLWLGPKRDYWAKKGNMGQFKIADAQYAELLESMDSSTSSLSTSNIIVMHRRKSVNINKYPTGLVES